LSSSPIKVFITGAANGLAEVREGLADHPEVELVGTAADPAKAGTKLAESGAQVILHGTTSTDHVPTAEIEAIRGVTAAPIVLVTSASANALLSEALSAGIFDVVLLPQLTDGIVFTIKKANSLAAGRSTGSGGAKTAAALEGRVVTFFSPKGGAGKTVLACNLAATVARQQQRRTLLMDLDLQFGDAAIMMGIEPEKTIYDLVMARRELDTDALAGYVTAHSSGVHVLPAPLRPEDAELVTEERLGHRPRWPRRRRDRRRHAAFFHGRCVHPGSHRPAAAGGIARRADGQEHQADDADARPAAPTPEAAAPAAEPGGSKSG
jgi:pilus assembly protein CpaE